MTMLAPEQKKPVMRPYLSVAREFVSGKQTPREFLEASLALLEQWEPKIGAFVCTNVPAARAAADRSTARWRADKPLSAIDGMPVGIKDIIETVDMPTEMGSPLFAGWRSEKDAACVRALRDAGAVILGKTVTTELAAFEPRGTRNPWNVAHTPGGSSSGSAAAVAAGMVPLAFGTQTAGSIIRPACYCGVVGYEPSFGLIARAGVKALADSLDTIGCIARSVEDAAFFIGVLTDRRALREVSAPLPPRFGMCRTPVWAEAEPATVAALDRASPRTSDDT